MIVDEYASATSIRELATSRNFYALDKLMPKISYDILADEIKKGHYISGIERFEKEIMFTLRNMSVAEIANLPDVNEGLEKKKKTKRYTSTRIHRILLYALLGITKEDMENSKKLDALYIRVLGFNSKGQTSLSNICNENKKLNVITSVKQFTTTCRNKKLLMMLEKDIQATNIYTLGYDYDSYSNLDYTTKLITY